MEAIKTPEDWWKVFDDNLDDICVFCKAIGISLYDPILVNGYLQESFIGALKTLRSEEDYQSLGAIMQEIWEVAPDQRWIHEYRGFYVVCDLCSEAWVFYESFEDFLYEG